MTFTINKNVLIFIVALVGLGVAGYILGTQLNKSPESTAAVDTSAEAGQNGANLQMTQPTMIAEAKPADNAPRIEIEEFKKAFDEQAGWIVVDVRTADQYAAGHIAGAVSIPEAEVSARMAELPKDKHIVLYCA
jgi:hypothetical protein